MKKIIFILIFSFFLACDTRESKSYYPANPPVDLKITLLTSGAYSGDYLLLFRSENRKNTRFGGFLIFIDSSEELVLEMTDPESAGYKLGAAADPFENPLIYNPASGIDVQMAILFTNSPAPSDNTIIVNATVYTLTKILNKNFITPASWLTMRSYLWDGENAVILQVSNTGNVVQIP